MNTMLPIHLALSDALMFSAAAQAKPSKKQSSADEQLSEAIQGTWVARPDPTNGAIAAWLWTDVQGGTHSGSNIIDVLDIATGQEVRLTFSGSDYTLTHDLPPEN